MNLALMEMRLLTARMMLNLDIMFVPGETGKKILEENKDYFTLDMAGALGLNFRRKKRLSCCWELGLGSKRKVEVGEGMGVFCSSESDEDS